jgi:hypothetical protein
MDGVENEEFSRDVETRINSSVGGIHFRVSAMFSAVSNAPERTATIECVRGGKDGFTMSFLDLALIFFFLLVVLN